MNLRRQIKILRAGLGDVGRKRVRGLIEGNVISADMHCVGQLRPRETVTFSCVSLEEAIAALRDQERRFEEAFDG